MGQDLDEDQRNANFVQVSRQYLKQWRGLIRQNGLAAEILMYLVENMGRTSNAVVCSYRVLQETTGYSRSSVANAIKLLKDDNWVQTIKIGTATAYAVNERVVWQAARNQRHYALFSATVVAAASEQPSDFREKAKEKLRHIPIIDQGEQPVIGSEELPPPDQLDMPLD